MSYFKFWLPDLDSNQDKLHQKQSYYHYTIGQSGPFFEWSAKIGVGVKFSKYLWVLRALLFNFLNLTIQIHNQVLKSTLWAVNYYY